MSNLFPACVVSLRSWVINYVFICPPPHLLYILDGGDWHRWLASLGIGEPLCRLGSEAKAKWPCTVSRGKTNRPLTFSAACLTHQPQKDKQAYSTYRAACRKQQPTNLPPAPPHGFPQKTLIKQQRADQCGLASAKQKRSARMYRLRLTILGEMSRNGMVYKRWKLSEWRLNFISP